MIDKDKDIDYVLRTGLSPSWYCYVHNFLIDKDKEIEKLNTIIDELKKELNKEIEFNNYKNGVRKLDKKLTQGGYLYRDYIKELLIELEKSK